MGHAELDDYQQYYKEKLEGAIEFQDHVADLLYSEGFPVVNYQSRKWQNEKGENRAGIEIKFDQKFRETGNLYIELEEKAHPDNMCFVRSGIYREDNGWLFAIGDYQTLFVFSTRLLVGLHRSNRYREVSQPTSKGLLLPLVDAAKYAAKVIGQIAA